MQMDINVELQKRIDKYDINRQNPEIKRYQQIVKILSTLIDSIPQESVIAICDTDYIAIGAFFTAIGYERRKRIRYIVSPSPLDGFTQKNIQWESEEVKQIDVMLITSLPYRRDFLNLARQRCENDTRIIELYDFLEEHGIVCNAVFYAGISISYRSIYRHVNLFDVEKSDKGKERLLEIIISEYLLIRDFVGAEKYIQLYIKENYSRKDVYTAFWDELGSLFEEIKKKRKSRKQKDIIINWVDALRFKEIEQTTYLKSVAQKGVFFEKAYTVTPDTSWTMTEMLTGKYAIDDKLPPIYRYNSSTCQVIEYMEKRGYQFKYFGYHLWWKFDDSFRSQNLHGVQSIDTRRGERSASSVYQWEAVRELLLNEGDKPCCYIIHNLSETHTPFLSGDMSGMHNDGEALESMDSLEQIEQVVGKGRNYIDKLLEWYGDFLREDDIKIYMSDHGKMGKKRWDNAFLHIMFMIAGKGIMPQREKEFFSLISFGEILQGLVEKHRVMEASVQYVISQTTDIYGKAAVKNVVEAIQKNRLTEQEDVTAMRCVTTAVDRYVLSYTGKEYYYILPDEENNLIEASVYQKRIDKLRKIAGNYFIDVYQSEYYSESRVIHNAMDIHAGKEIQLI